MEKVTRLENKKGKILVPIDPENGYLVDEGVLRLYASSNKAIQSLGDGTAGSHNDFLKALVRDYVSLYRKLEMLGEL